MSKVHTIQMETDTVVEEREAILQKALSVSNAREARQVRDQILEHIEMYEGDEGVAVLEDQLLRLETLLGEQTPEAIDYMAKS